jgi:hypothetical protein
MVKYREADGHHDSVQKAASVREGGCRGTCATVSLYANNPSNTRIYFVKVGLNVMFL